jgi:hypothetical protein
MAIVVEEEKTSKAGLVGILMWVAVVGVVGASVYYIFVKKPDFIGKVIAPKELENISQLSDVTLNPETIINNPVYQSLRAHVGPRPTPQAGRANPFLPF